MIKYRVILRIGYYEAVYEFDTVEEAGGFASTALLHQIPSEDNRSAPAYVTIRAVNIEKEKEEDDE